MEASLKLDEKVFQVYQARRAAQAEQDAARWFQLALKPELLITNIAFETPHGNGETDVLVRVDDLLIIVEVKTGALSEDAYTGRKAALTRDLSALLGRSSEQNDRLAQGVRDGEQVTFNQRASGRAVSVNVEGTSRVRSVVVTLEDLTPIVMRPRLLTEAGIIDSAATMPWCVSQVRLGSHREVDGVPRATDELPRRPR
jgi:hypothetical protein